MELEKAIEELEQDVIWTAMDTVFIRLQNHFDMAIEGLQVK